MFYIYIHYPLGSYMIRILNALLCIIEPNYFKNTDKACFTIKVKYSLEEHSNAGGCHIPADRLP